MLEGSRNGDDGRDSRVRMALGGWHHVGRCDGTLGFRYGAGGGATGRGGVVFVVCLNRGIESRYWRESNGGEQGTGKLVRGSEGRGVW